jgi:endoglucanase
VTTLLDRVKELTNLDAISGQEQPVVAYLVEALAPFCDEVEVDGAGNVYAIRRAQAPGPTVMIAAHTDEIGLMVKSVEPGGFLRFEKIGGVLDNLLAARLVRVKGHLGVIGMKAGHYQSPEERSRAAPHTEMYIDIGCRSVDEVAARGIAVGDAIAFVSPLVELGEGLIAGKAVDNRLGCAILLQLIQETAPPAGTLVATFTTQEEVGLKGAAVAGFRVRPDLGLALDTMPCGDTPDMNVHTELSARLGGGPCVQVSSGPGGRGFLLPLPVKAFLVETARAAELPVQLVTFSAGNNDAAAIGWSAEGVAAASICLPRRYAHSPLEVADLHDAEATYDLLRAIVARMDALPAFDFLTG